MDIWNPRLDGFVPESGDSCFILSLVRGSGACYLPVPTLAPSVMFLVCISGNGAFGYGFYKRLDPRKSLGWLLYVDVLSPIRHTV